MNLLEWKRVVFIALVGWKVQILAETTNKNYDRL